MKNIKIKQDFCFGAEEMMTGEDLASQASKEKQISRYLHFLTYYNTTNAKYFILYRVDRVYILFLDGLDF